MEGQASPAALTRSGIAVRRTVLLGQTEKLPDAVPPKCAWFS